MTTLPEEQEEASVDSEEEDELANGLEKVNLGVARPATESSEEKKLRKQAIKAQRKERRMEKKTSQSVFKKEIRNQVQMARIKTENSSHVSLQ